MTRKSQHRKQRDGIERGAKAANMVPNAERVLVELSKLRPDLDRTQLVAWVNTMPAKTRSEMVAKIVQMIGEQR